MTFYADVRADADEALTEFGQSMTLTKRTSGAYNPATGASTVTTATHTVTGAVFDYPAKLIDGTHILRGDKRVLLSAEGIGAVPDVDDTLTIGGVVHQIIDIKPLEPGGTAVLYTVQVRK